MKSLIGKMFLKAIFKSLKRKIEKLCSNIIFLNLGDPFTAQCCPLKSWLCKCLLYAVSLTVSCPQHRRCRNLSLSASAAENTDTTLRDLSKLTCTSTKERQVSWFFSPSFSFIHIGISVHTEKTRKNKIEFFHIFFNSLVKQGRSSISTLQKTIKTQTIS